MDKLLEKYNFPKLNQQQIENLNRPITNTEIETVIRNLLTNKSSSRCEFYQILREELTLTLLKLIQKIEEKEYSRTHSMRPQLPQYQNQEKILQKLQANITDENRHKNPQQSISNLNPTVY